MRFIFEALLTLRKNTLNSIAHLSDEQLHIIPAGLNNHIAWNLGHMVASQQGLCYRLGNVPLLVPQDFIEKYKKGSHPKEWTSPANIDQIREYFALTSSRFEEDYAKGLFANFTEYPTSSGMVLKNIDDSVVYNYGHENLHYGVILNLRKLV